MSNLPLTKWHPNKGISTKVLTVDKKDLVEACYLWGFMSNTILDIRKKYLDFLVFNENIQLSNDYEILDSTTKVNISFNLGMIFSVFFTKQIFGKVDILDVNILEKYNLITIDKKNKTRRRPDFLFFLPDVNKPFFIEAKCNADKAPEFDNWKEQVNSISHDLKTINSSNVYKNVQGYITDFRYDSIKNIFTAEVIDPEIEIKLNYSVEEIVSLYYEKLNLDMKDNINYSEKHINDKNYFGLSIDGIYIGVNEKKKIISKRSINNYDLYENINDTVFKPYEDYKILSETTENLMNALNEYNTIFKNAYELFSNIKSIDEETIKAIDNILIEIKKIENFVNKLKKNLKKMHDYKKYNIIDKLFDCIRFIKESTHYLTILCELFKTYEISNDIIKKIKFTFLDSELDEILNRVTTLEALKHGSDISLDVGFGKEIENKNVKKYILID